MKRKFKIVAEEQGWLDAFNTYSRTKYKLNEVLELKDSKHTELLEQINKFNYEVAFGPAIDLEEEDK